jgi:hypothetical protein
MIAVWGTPDKLDKMSLAELEETYTSVAQQLDVCGNEVVVHDLLDTRKALYEAIERKKS